MSVFCQRALDLELRRSNVLTGAEQFHMRRADRGYNTDLGTSDIRKQLDLAGARHTHFKDCEIRIIGESQKRHRKPDHAIEITLSLPYLTGCGKNRSNEFLCCGLANASGNTDASRFAIL